jgi:hypothetical protein
METKTVLEGLAEITKTLPSEFDSVAEAVAKALEPKRVEFTRP